MYEMQQETHNAAFLISDLRRCLKEISALLSSSKDNVDVAALRHNIPGALDARLHGSKHVGLQKLMSEAPRGAQYRLKVLRLVFGGRQMRLDKPVKERLPGRRGAFDTYGGDARWQCQVFVYLQSNGVKDSDQKYESAH